MTGTKARAPRGPRGPRPPVVRETPKAPEAAVVTGDGTGEALPPLEARGAVAVLEGPSVPIVSTVEPYDGKYMVCRKPFKLGGQKYTRGDQVPVDLIPRPESWVRTGFLQEAS